jgi:hypothetical protein
MRKLNLLLINNSQLFFLFFLFLIINKKIKKRIIYSEENLGISYFKKVTGSVRPIIKKERECLGYQVEFGKRGGGTKGPSSRFWCSLLENR